MSLGYKVSKFILGIHPADSPRLAGSFNPDIVLESRFTTHRSSSADEELLEYPSWTLLLEGTPAVAAF